MSDQIDLFPPEPTLYEKLCKENPEKGTMQKCKVYYCKEFEEKRDFGSDCNCADCGYRV